MKKAPQINAPEQELPPPQYDEVQAERVVIDSVREDAVLKDDGRIDVDLDSRLSRTLSKLVKIPIPGDPALPPPPTYTRYATADHFPLRLNIVIQVVGSRGDVQPFVALGNGLQKCGHRVRLATHGNFEKFVHDAGLEFYPIGGDPEDLMSYMVKNPGLMPSMQSLRAGDISRKREMIEEMLEGCWNSCIAADPLTNEPFVADAIIANPVSFAHVHCAEALGIPLHLMFTMPWSATTSFPHPIANITNGSKNPKLANYLSYVLVEVMTWQGLGDVINSWRGRIGLEPVPNTEGPMLAATLSIPFTYCWSPALIPKPQDWPAHIDVAGFFFRGAPQYSPPSDLREFLEDGPPPVYIGFGSIVLDNAAAMSALILEAVTACGLRAIISRGWSRLDGPERRDIFWLEDCPHEWLFQHVSVVVHHGGAGTTACGLLNARPTAIVPFFGDQPFWGDMVAAAGSGPKPIHHKSLNAENLAEALRFCHQESAQTAAVEIANQMKEEDGVQAAVMSFLNHLPVEKMQCDFLPDQAASWALKINKKPLKISRLAAEILVRDEGLDPKNLKVYRSSPILIENRRWDPLTGTVSSLLGTGTDMVTATSGIFLKPAEEYRRGHSRSATPGGNSNSNSNTSRPQSRQPSTANSSTTDLASLNNSSTASAAPTSDPRSSTPTAATGISESSRGNGNVAGSMALASGKSLGKFFSSYSKGVLVDLPLATTEGFRSLPRMWGSEVADYGKVTGVQSGFVVAGKTFALGIGDGFRDLARQPAEGMAKEGAWGAFKGLAKGSGSLLSKTVSGGLGLVAYPGQGITKSLWTLTHGEAGKRVMEARRAEGASRAAKADEKLRHAVLRAYYEANVGASV